MTEYSLAVIGHIDPALVEEIDLARPKKRRLSPRFPTFLIAACLCLALLGAACAAGNLIGVFKGSESIAELYPGVTLEGTVLHLSGIETVPQTAFNEEFIDAVKETQNGELYYLSREAAQADMGFSLAENSVLETFTQGICTISIPGDYFCVQSAYLFEDVTIKLNTTVYMAGSTSIPPESTGMIWMGVDTIRTDEYKMPDGSTACIQEVMIENEPCCYRADFIWDGILYEMSLWHIGVYREEVRELLENILASFS